jgi:hypothetical protein
MKVLGSPLLKIDLLFYKAQQKTLLLKIKMYNFNIFSNLRLLNIMIMPGIRISIRIIVITTIIIIIIIIHIQ